MVEGVELDVCNGGCAGVWFDQFELKKLDETHECDPHSISSLQVSNHQMAPSEHKMKCPKCPDITMRRYFFGAKRKVEIDECAACAGIWLDAHELVHIHQHYDSDEEKQKAFDELFSKEFGQQMEALKKNQEDNQKFINDMTHSLRYITPSYYFKKAKDFFKDFED